MTPYQTVTSLHVPKVWLRLQKQADLKNITSAFLIRPNSPRLQLQQQHTAVKAVQTAAQVQHVISSSTVRSQPSRISPEPFTITKRQTTACLSCLKPPLRMFLQCSSAQGVSTPHVQQTSRNLMLVKVRKEGNWHSN